MSSDILGFSKQKEFSCVSKTEIYCVKLCIYPNLAINDHKYNVILMHISIAYLKCITHQLCGYLVPKYIAGPESSEICRTKCPVT